MKLTKAQQNLLDRAKNRVNRNGDSMFAVYNHRAFNWNNDKDTCDLFGSSQIRCANRLEELGLGYTHSVQPLDRTFFTAYQNDEERIKRETEQKAFWDKIKEDWKAR